MPGTTVTGAAFMHDLNASGDSELSIESLFSGYGGLDLAVEHVLNAKTVWFSELNAPVARVFSRHWPDVPNLGDITTIDWSQVEPVDILIGGFPGQDVSTIDFALYGPGGSPNRRAGSETMWSLIDGLFSSGYSTATPSPAGNTSPDAPHQRHPS